jgi:hypothetical protein
MNSRIKADPTAWNRFLDKYWVLYLIVLLLAMLFAIALIFCHSCTPCDNSTLLQRIHELETGNETGIEAISEPIVEDIPENYEIPTADEVDDRREEAGGEVGKVTATLFWHTKDDLDILALQPNNNELSPRTKIDTSTQGKYDVDVNFQGVLTSSPIENIFWEMPDVGNYLLVVRLYERRTTGSVPINFTLHWKVEGQRIIEKHGTLNKTGDQLKFYFTY